MFVTHHRTAAALLAVVLLGACGDRTVTSEPADAVRAVPAADIDPDLAEIERIVDQIETEIGHAEREATTAEGDPAR